MGSTNVVAIAGYRNVGKDQAAKVLVEKGYQYSRLSYGISRALAALYGIDPRRCDGVLPEDKVWRGLPNASLGYKTPREAMIFLGEKMREFDPDVWVRQAFSSSSNTVIPDLRKYSDACYLKQKGAQIWYISRPGYDVANGPEEKEVYSLKSLSDVVFKNAGTLDDLRAEIEYYMHTLK